MGNLVLIQTLPDLSQQVIALQRLTKCVLCPIMEQDLRVGFN